MWHSRFYHCLWHGHPMWVLVQSLLFHFWSSFQLVCLERQWNMVHVLGPLPDGVLGSWVRPDPALAVVANQEGTSGWRICLSLCNNNSCKKELYYFKLTSCVLKHSEIHSQIEQKVQYTLLFPHTQSLPHCQHTHQSGTFVNIWWTFMCNYYPKSILYIKVHSWCHVFHGFRRMHKDMYIPM